MLEDNTKKIKEEQLEPAEELISMEMIEFISSERTSSQIADICLKNGVENEVKIEEVSYRIALVILGKLPKENLALTLERGVGLIAKTAKKIADEANQFILSQPSLPKTEKTATAMPTLTTPPKGEVREKSEEKPAEELKRPPGKDTYREPIA